MDDDFQSHNWIFACLPSCFRHCFRRWIGTLAHIDPERQPLFPPPSTILTPPRPRPNLPSLSGLAQTNAPWRGDGPISPALGTGRLEPSIPPTPALSEADRIKMDSISKAFAGRMKPLHPNSSLPPTPTSAYHSVIRPLSSMQGIQLQTSSSTSALKSNSIADSKTKDDRPRPDPIRPSVPNLGRSTSEPRNLADLAGFAPHQVPLGHQVFIGGERGRGGRSRSATTFDGLRGRGRSPGPFLEGFTRTKSLVDNAGNAREGEDGMGRSKSHSRLSALINSESTAEQVKEEEVQGVVKKELGLRGLYNVGSSSSFIHSTASVHGSGSNSGSVRRGKSRLRGQRTARGMRRVMTG